MKILKKLWRARLLVIIPLDKVLSIGLYYLIDLFIYLFVAWKGVIEEYINKKEYCNLSRFERFISADQENMFALLINHKMTYNQVYLTIFEKSGGTLKLSKRQCYKLKKLAKIPA